MKPILIDALHINMGGALMILNHFVSHLLDRDIKFVLLKDDRCPELIREKEVETLLQMSSAVSQRHKFYKEHRNEFSAVFCMANVPPTIQLDVPVHTYVHNVSLLKIPRDYTGARKIKAFLKKMFISGFSGNTDTWIVQTSYTASLVRECLPCKGKKVLIYPFYHIPEALSNASEGERRDYVFVGEHTFAKGHEYLIDAWCILSEKLGSDCPVLHLTVESEALVPYIKKAVSAGAKIHNHGRIPFNEICRLYQRSKATVYPSLNESLGLGIVEALSAGCDLIACNLPYVHSISKPSITFKPCDAHSIVSAVMEYERGASEKSQLLIRDMADDLIDFITIKE